MKKLFNHTKKSYDDKWDEYEEEYDWDQPGEEDAQDYYAGEDGEDETVYSDEEEPEEAYYAEEEEGADIEADADAYYAGEEEGADAEEGVQAYYAEEDGEADYSQEESGYFEEEEFEGEEFEEAEEADPEEAYYGEEDFEEFPPDKGKKGLAALWQRFMEMDFMDRVIGATGVTVLLLAVITGVVFFSAKAIERQVNDFVSVGSQLEGITIIGDKGLTAVADAEMARLNAELGLLDQPGYQEEDYNSNLVIALDLTSIQKDLKIKFINESNGKLVPNVPFSVTVTRPDKETEVWEDDDRDGIIYQKGIEPGNYQVVMNALTDTKYADYAVSPAAFIQQKVAVKKDIEYKKVNVGNEVKSESQINASKEDTKKKEVMVESVLEDTVAWVESSQTSNRYREVSRSNVTDPKTKVRKGSFTRLASAANGSVTIKVGGTASLTVQPGENETVSVTRWESGTPSIATVDNNGTVTGVAAGTATITATVHVSTTTTTSAPPTTSGGDASGGNAGEGTGTTTTITESDQTITFSVTVEQTAPPAPTLSVKLDKSEVAVNVGATADVTATPEGITDATIGASSADATIATVSVTGNKITVTGVKAGETTVTVTAAKDGVQTATATLKVKVNGSSASLAIGQSAVTVFVGETVKIGATVSNATASEVKIQATSADANVAEVTGEIANNGELVITGKAAGSTTITATYTENGVVVKQTCAVTVKSNPKDDKNTRLKDNSGNQLYVKENGSHREAVYADYYTDVTLYIMDGAKYTGWQTIDGKVYYFDANGNKVTGEQVIQGAKYNFASDGSLVQGSGTMGIDVSKWNGTIDWKAVKNSGVSYVIIRVGYRGSSVGSLVEDPKFAANIKGATNAGLKVGIYFFSQAVDEVEAVEEASMVLDRISGYKISYPIFIDVEASGGRADGISKETRTAVCKAFCQTIQREGYTAGVYSNKSWLTSKLDAGALGAYKIWLAQYRDTPTYTGKYDLWQYRSTGRVSGISGDVDMNISYLGY